MFIKPEIVSELPNAQRVGRTAAYTEVQAQDFYAIVLLGQGKWVKFFEATFENGKVAKPRHAALAIYDSTAFKPFRKSIQVVTRTDGNKLSAYARHLR